MDILDYRNKILLLILSLLLATIMLPKIGIAQPMVPPPFAEPVEILDSLWNAFDDRYALFRDKGVPWQSIHHSYRMKAKSVQNDEELFEIMAEMLSLLNDNHVKLTGWGGILSAAGDHQNVTAINDFSTTVVRNNYLQSPIIQPADGLISYAWLSDSIGYIHVTAMGDQAASTEAMKDALTLFSESEGVVLDIRRNFGGDDRVSQALASLFADQPRHYMTTYLKRGRGRDDFTKPRYWSLVPPLGGGFTKPVIVLTHSFTFSAGETFLLGLRELPYTIVVGTPTSGSMGETYNDVIPNGWVYRTVIQRIVDSKGRSWEGPGISPDLRVVNTPEEIKSGKDRVLEFAIDLLSAKIKNLIPNNKSSVTSFHPIKYPLSDSLASWLKTMEPKAAMNKFDSLRKDTTRWFLSEDWKYGDLVTLGHNLLDEEQLNKAIMVFEASVEAYPKSYRPYAGLWKAYTQSTQPQKSQTNREKALSLNTGLYDQDQKNEILMRGMIPVSYQFIETLFDDGPDQAIAQYQETLKNESPRVVVDPLVLIQGAQQLREARQLKQALQVFTFITEEFSSWSMGYMGVAETHRMLGNTKAAIAAYREVIRLNPNYHQAYKKLREMESINGN